MNESKVRSVAKAIVWRLFATLNSYIILMCAITDAPLSNAIIMNITGLVIYYVYERVWNTVPYGKNIS